MTNKKRLYPMPNFKNLDEEDKFWQSHSPLTEGYQGKAQKKKQNKNSFLSVRLTGEELVYLREKAMRYGLGPSTYARQIIIKDVDSSSESLPPSLLLHLCSRFAPVAGKAREKYLHQLNELYKEYLSNQENLTKQIVTLYPMPDMPDIEEALNAKENSIKR